jgi:hypothetical protein
VLSLRPEVQTVMEAYAKRDSTGTLQMSAEQLRDFLVREQGEDPETLTLDKCCDIIAEVMNSHYFLLLPSASFLLPSSFRAHKPV